MLPQLNNKFMACRGLNIKVISLALFALWATSSVYADEAALQKQIQAQQRTMNDQLNQIDVLHQDIAELRGELEQLRYLLKRQQGGEYQAAPANAPAATPANASASNNVAPLADGSSGVTEEIIPTTKAGPVTPLGNDNLNTHLNGPVTTQTTTTTTTTNSNTPVYNQAPSGPVLKGVDPQAQQAYNTAYSYVQANNLDAAQRAFRSYIETYPDNTLTPNAWYWLGQVQYSQAQYEDARLSFLNVARYSTSQKRPDALYKLGMISKFMGDANKASRYFLLVEQTYPNNAAANLARRELERLQGQG